jgi:hypothetical protein
MFHAVWYLQPCLHVANFSFICIDGGTRMYDACINDRGLLIAALLPTDSLNIDELKTD